MTMTIRRSDWRKYPAIYSLLNDIDAHYAWARQNYATLQQSAKAAKLASYSEAAGILKQLMLLVDQASDLIDEVSDLSIDVPAWQIYMADLDTLVKLMWRMPAIYGTGYDFDTLDVPKPLSYIIQSHDTWDSIEKSFGIPWGVVARLNGLSSQDELSTGWVGTEIQLPRLEGRDAVPFIPGVVGKHAGAGILGRDVSNSLQLVRESVDATIATTLSGSMAQYATTSFNLTSAANFPDEGYARIGQEIVFYRGKSSNTIGTTSVSRGLAGTQPAAHSDSDVVTLTHVITELYVLPPARTFMQGAENAIEDSPVNVLLGMDFGAVKPGIIMIHVIDALKSDPRVGKVNNVRASIDGDKLVVSLEVESVGRLASSTLNKAL